MTTKLGTLTVDFLAKTGSFETDVKRARQTLDREGEAMEERAGGLKEELAGMGPAIGAAFAAAAGAVALAVKSAIDQADEISKLSQKIGISTEALSSLNVAAQLSDVSLQQLQGGLTRLIRVQEDVAEGTGNLGAVFDAIGVSATNADGSLRQTDAVLRDLADVFQALPDGAQKTALAVDIFGRAGANLIPLLNQGAEGLRKWDEVAERLGVRLSTETGQAAEAFNDNLTILKIGLQGVATQVAQELLPDLVDLTNQFTATDNKAKEVAESIRSVATFFGGLADVAGIVKNTIEGVVLSSIQLLNTLQAIGSLANPFKVIEGFMGGETTIQAAERNLREADVASIMAGEAFGRAGRRITGESESRAQAPIESITPETIAAGSPAGAGAGARDGDAIAESLRKLREEREKGAQAARAASEAERAFAQAQRDAAQAAAEAKRAEDERKAAAADFTSIVEEYRAELNGPLAQAELEWDRRQQQLQQLAERGQITQQQLAEALAVTTELRQRDVQAIEAQISPAQQVIADLEEELRLLQLSNVEREIANAQRFAGVDAFSAEGQAIAEGIRAIDEARERIQFSDDLRRGFEDTFASIIDGTKSAKDAFADLGSYITSLIAQRLGAQLVDSFLGPAGSPIGGGAGGNIFTSFLGSLFGGGRAAGGWVAPGKMYEVAENGPELLRVGNRQFLLPSATGGMVTPNARMGGGGGVVQNISVQGRIDTRTAAQLARETQRAQSRAAARFGA